MEKQFLILLFLTGVGTYVPRKYYMVQMGIPWSNARTYCKTYYDDLATIENTVDLALILSQSRLNYNFYMGQFWVGLYNQINSWHWSLGDGALGTLRNWDSGQPDNGGGLEECGMITMSGTWNDKSCSSLFPFICFDGSFTGSRSYIYYSVTKSWGDAQSYCRQFHTDLASATNATENSILAGLVSGGTWFGLKRGSWIWADQPNVSYIPWWPGHPNNVHGNDNCAFLTQNMLVDYPCTTSYYFFCHRNITEQRILRIKVQSIQDVNDSAVTAALLVQIQRKFMDNGLTDIKVTFRKQPDGLKFRKTSIRDV